MDATCAIQASIHVFSLVRKYVSRILGTYQNVVRGSFFRFIENRIAVPIKQKALRVDRTAAEQNLSLRDLPQAENPVLQDSIFLKLD